MRFAEAKLLQVFGFVILIDGQCAEPAMLTLHLDEISHILDSSRLMFGAAAAEPTVYGSAAHGRLFKRFYSNSSTAGWLMQFVRSKNMWSIM